MENFIFKLIHAYSFPSMFGTEPNKENSEMERNKFSLNQIGRKKKGGK